MTMFCSSAFKSTKQTPIGINLWAAPDEYNTIIIVAVDDHGLFSGKLKVGMQVDRINDLHCCGLTISQIELYLNEISGRITILASTPNLSKSSYWGSSKLVEATMPRLEEFSDDDSQCYSSDEKENDGSDELRGLLQARPSDHVFQRIMIAPFSIADTVVNLVL